MNRIELYVDSEDRLSIDFYLTTKDEYPMNKYKGAQCYPVIATLCKSSILSIKDNEQTEEVSLRFENSILNISEYGRTFGKRGTGPIKQSLLKYYEDEKKKTFKHKKVKRVNKHVNKNIIAGVLFLSLLGAILIGSSLMQKNTQETLPPETTISYEIEPTIDITIYSDEQIVSVEPGLEDNNVEVIVEYEDRSNTEKAQITRAYYGEIIEKYAKEYGIDPDIVLAIATQERGIHSTVRDPGGATGLMQIQNAVWAGNTITAYNYHLGEKETILVDENSLSDVFYNIKIGCMYFQNCMDYMNNNVLAAIQCYNYGYGNMQAVLREYSLQTGKSIQEILSNISDCEWMECRDVISENVGDKRYIEHVLSWIGPKINIENTSFKNMPSNLVITNSSSAKIR